MAKAANGVKVNVMEVKVTFSTGQRATTATGHQAKLWEKGSTNGARMIIVQHGERKHITTTTTIIGIMGTGI